MSSTKTFRMDALPSQPKMNSSSIIQSNQWRIGILTDSLIRFEWANDGHFEDLPTQTILNRNFKTPAFTVNKKDGLLIIETKYLRITYNQQPFSKEGLSVFVKDLDTQFNTWHYGDVNVHNLGGTARTLDVADGAIDLEQGLLSFDGWAVLDDSTSNEIASAESVHDINNPFGAWIMPRTSVHEDLYFFGYGHRYRDAIHAFYALTGPTPLLPRYALGNWWSRFYKYSESEYLNLMDRFRNEGIPFSVAVIDMDWHLVQLYGAQGSGWTGYTWNRELFPDPKRFLTALHDRGMATTLNVHPRDGIRSFEDGYDKAARTTGINPSSKEPVIFDLTSPIFVQAYFDLHHDLERDGVDFWWIDWQQGGVTKQKGLDPLWMLNHMHYLDSGRDGKRPLTFSRYAGPGSHRYPVGFSGDSVVSWASLKFQPYFTATASNIGYGWWSHDIGGHMFGVRDEELEARWYQFGVFSPINRLHSTCSPFNGKEPWNFRTEVKNTMIAALRLRHEMIPYLYTMNWRAAAEDEPLMEPMYWQEPDNDNAYDVPNEYHFGTELIVAPITSPCDRESTMAKTNVWLPQGTWFDFFDGRKYQAPCKTGLRFEAWRGLERIPVFAKAGGIIPLQRLRDDQPNDLSNPSHMKVIVFPGASGQFTMVEDDGNNVVPDKTAMTRTIMTFSWKDTIGTVFHISPATGSADAIPVQRSWNLVFRGVAPLQQNSISVTVGGKFITTNLQYDSSTLSLSLNVDDVPTNAELSVIFTSGLSLADDPVRDDVFSILNKAQMHYLTKEKTLSIIEQDGIRSLMSLHTMEIATNEIATEDARKPSDSFAWLTLNPIHRPDFLKSHMPNSVMRALIEVFMRNNSNNEKEI